MLLVVNSVCSQNPIVPNQGLNDPHIHIFNDTAYVYASHDKSITNDKFIMDDWWVWSSPDLVNWTKRSVLQSKRYLHWKRLFEMLGNRCCLQQWKVLLVFFRRE